MIPPCLAKFVFNEKALKRADPQKIRQLCFLSANLWQEIYNPDGKRLGLRFLQKQLTASSQLAVWPRTFREALQIKATDFPFKIDAEAAEKRKLETKELIDNVPMPTRQVYQSFMRANDIRRKKKMRSINAIKAKAKAKK